MCLTCKLKTKKNELLLDTKEEKKPERTACLLFELLVFVKNNLGVFFFACLVFELTGVRATVEKRVKVNPRRVVKFFSSKSS